MVELPLNDADLSALLAQIDLILVTHTHRDHWDKRAVELLPKSLPLICQPADVDRFRQDGFSDVQPIEREGRWQNIQLSRTDGKHGTGEIGQLMGTVSGFVLRAEGEPSLYIAGDTIWCEDVQRALSTHQPQVTVVNAGAAQFLKGDPITMSAADVEQVLRARPSMPVVAVHMETINHCWLTRAMLKTHLQTAGLAERCAIPADGEMLSFSA